MGDCDLNPLTRNVLATPAAKTNLINLALKARRAAARARHPMRWRRRRAMVQPSSLRAVQARRRCPLPPHLPPPPALPRQMVMVVMSTAAGANRQVQVVVMVVCSGYIAYSSILAVRGEGRRGGWG